MPSFYNGKRFFLTYAKCPITRKDLQAFIRGVAPVRYILVAQEQHQDGTDHLHCCVEFEASWRKPVDWLDFTYDGKTYHPNKQDPRKWEACKNYCKKDDTEYLEMDFHKLWPEDEEQGEMGLQETCFSFDKEEDWYAYCVTNKISFCYAQYFWTRLHGDHCTILDDEHEGQVCTALESFQYPRDSRKCVIIRGPSGCGKTTWAKRNMPKPCLFVSHVDQLKLFRGSYHKSIIFDDVSFAHTPRTNQIAIVDYENARAIHCRHAVATIPANVPKVFTCNEWPVEKNDEAIARRCKFYTVSGWLNEIKSD